MLKAVIFDAERHLYFDDAGRKVPGVTEVLHGTVASASWYRGTDARTLGKYVHLATQYDDEGTLDIGTLDNDVFDRVIAWRAFKRDFKVVVHEAERLVFHPVLRFAGTCDRSATVMGQKAVVDIKSGVWEDWFALQTAAYGLAYEGQGKRHKTRYSVRLLPGGQYDVRRYDSERDRATFLACLGVYNWKLEHE